MATHVHDTLLPEIRTEAGLPEDVPVACLVQPYDAEGNDAQRIIDQFKRGASLETLPADTGHCRVALDRTTLEHILQPLFARGEHDSSFYDHVRSDAVLMHIWNVRTRSIT